MPRQYCKFKRLSLVLTRISGKIYRLTSRLTRVQRSMRRNIVSYRSQSYFTILKCSDAPHNKMCFHLVRHHPQTLGASQVILNCMICKRFHQPYFRLVMKSKNYEFHTVYITCVNFLDQTRQILLDRHLVRFRNERLSCLLT